MLKIILRKEVPGKNDRFAARDPFDRRRLRLMECNAKCRYLKKLTCKGTLLQVFYLSEAPYPPMTLYSPSSYTLYTCIQLQYTNSHREGGEGGES